MKIKIECSELHFEIDDEDADKLYSHNTKFYIANGGIICYSKIHTKKLKIARIIMDLYNRSNILIDHIDHNILNNKKSNLRFANKSQNAANVIKIKNRLSSQFKGVSWSKYYKKWEAYIKVNYKKINLGYFKDEEDAAIAYNIAAIEFFKEFASLNDINFNLMTT